MARTVGPKCRLCRREGVKLYLKGVRCESDKCAIEKRNQVPGVHKMRKKLTGYGIQLREKQKMKRMYGVLEKQFRNTFKKASRLQGITGDNLIQLLERRLDNVVTRMLFVPSRAEARQFIKHGYIRVNGKKVDIPSYLIKVGDEISISEKAKGIERVEKNLDMLQDRTAPDWISVDQKAKVGSILRLPTKDDANLGIEENLIVELYSK